MTTIIDRRLNPSGKSLPNRQRFLGRAKAQIKKAVDNAISKRGIKDAADGKGVEVDTGGVLDEPGFSRGRPGDHDYVLPGNQEHHKGDTLPRPPSGGGRGTSGSPDGDGLDDFAFTLTRDEFLSIFFEDMELPNLERRQLATMDETKPKRAGFSTSGSPSSVNVVRTMRRGMARRIALGRPDEEEMEQLSLDVAQAILRDDEEGEAAARLAVLEAEERIRRIPYLEPTTDLRYNRFEQKPQPRTSAVMFCLMDVSGSMTEQHKDIAKRFFMLLYLFLLRSHAKVEIVFIRYHHEAKEVDEHTFFYGQDTGGTNVSTSLVEMIRIQKERFPTSDWNIYGAMASDGDNNHSDNEAVFSTMTDEMHKIVNYFAYLEVKIPYVDDFGYGFPLSDGGLWKTFERVAVATPGPWFAAKQAKSAKDVYAVLADLFAKNRQEDAA